MQNSTITSLYNFNDENPYKGINYYRLKQIDLDNKFVYSSIIALNKSNVDGNLQLFPNPCKGSFMLNLNTDSKVIITNALGMLVKQVSLSEGMQKIDLIDAPSGIYFVEIMETNGNVEKLKLQVE